jgi:predicted DNA binding protein
MDDPRVCTLRSDRTIPAETADRLDSSSTVELVEVDRPAAVADSKQRRAILIGPGIDVSECVAGIDELGVPEPVIAIIDDQSLVETEADAAIHGQTARECPAAAVDRIESVARSHGDHRTTCRRRLDRLERVVVATSESLEAITTVDSPTRLAATLCRQLADAGGYDTAVYYEYDVGSDAVDLKTVSGASGAAKAEQFDSPPLAQTARDAVSRSEPVLTGIEESPVAADRSTGALAFVPIARDAVPYGVLAVVADQSIAFCELERRLLSLFGCVVADVIVSLQQKRALAHGDSVEIEIELEDPEHYFVGVSDRDDCWAELDGLLVDEDTNRTRAFVRTTGSRAAIEAQAAVNDWIDSISILSRNGDERLVELVGESIPIVEFMATHGATMRKATATDGSGRVVFEFPSDADVGRLLALLGAESGTAELVARRTGSETLRGAKQFRRLLERELTDRQHEVLLTAYHSGFFRWPRERTGEELAETLDITQPTFHEHLRTAQDTLLQTLLEDDRSLYLL